MEKFKLRSGNKSPLEFKQMGSSPAKQEVKLTNEQKIQAAKNRRERAIKERMRKHTVSREESVRRQSEIESMTPEQKEKAGIM